MAGQVRGRCLLRPNALSLSPLESGVALIGLVLSNVIDARKRPALYLYDV